MDGSNELILILDFGGHYKELAARSVRSCGVYSEIRHGGMSAEKVRALNPIGIILTGGNESFADNPLVMDKCILELDIPVLGVCTGMNLICSLSGGTVGTMNKDYAAATVRPDVNSSLFRGLNNELNVLVGGDYVSALPDGFVCTAKIGDIPNAAFENSAKRLYGIQFYFESEGTENGAGILHNFLFGICGAKGDYSIDGYIEKQIAAIRAQAGNEKVLLALSGGVDSSVCASLLSKAIPGQLTCVFVDHGLMRLNEGNDVETAFKGMELNFIRINAEERFLSKLHGVTEPEAKRKIIGAEFIEIFQEEAAKLGDIKYLAQGTIYPDIAESGGSGSAVIKSHHNVGGLPENMKFSGLIEPLSGLFKDEVRVLGTILGLPPAFVQRQPFPGPGLGVRIMGEVTKEKLDILREADAIFCEEIGKLQKQPDQYFAVYTGISSVGITEGKRAYEGVIALRAVDTSDYMTCEYTALPHSVLAHAANRIINEVFGVGRVVYDITAKPPGTIEWE